MFPKKVDKKLVKKCGWQKSYSKRLTKNAQILQRVLSGGRGDDKEKRGVEKRKQDSLHCAFALQDPCWHFNLISWKKELLFMRYLLNDERYYAHLVCVLLPSRIPAGLSIWSQRWQINRCWKFRFHLFAFHLNSWIYIIVLISDWN